MAQLVPGDLVAGRFRIRCLIGQGGMGQVYEVEQLNLGRTVALKVLRPEIGDQPGARARFQREARVAAALRHGGAVQIHDFGEDRGQLFLAMERLVGGTLRDALGPAQGRRNPLESIERALAIASQVADVLVAAHAISLVHRDLKPSNIFLTAGPDGAERAVVADFGLAFIQDREDAGRLTRDGVLAGTPAYISPEQALGRDLGPATDVYSLGCTLFEMLTGSVPFVDDSEVGVITKHLFGTPDSPRSMRHDVPQALDDLVLAMLAKRPEERPGPAQVLGALSAIAGRLGRGERGRGELPVLAREARMIAEPSPALDGATLGEVPTPPRPPGPAQASSAADAIVVATFGAIAEETGIALAANGLVVRPLASIDDAASAGDARALYAPGASLEDLERLADLDLPLVTDAAGSDMARVAALVALGADEVVTTPARPADLARRLRRAIKLYRGRRRR